VEAAAAGAASGYLSCLLMQPNSDTQHGLAHACCCQRNNLLTQCWSLVSGTICRLQFELKSSGAVHVLSDLQATASSSQQSGSGSSATNYPGLDSFQPQWLLLSESNDWRKRVQVAQRFVQAVRVVICRNRAQTRLRKLRSLAGTSAAVAVCSCGSEPAALLGACCVAAAWSPSTAQKTVRHQLQTCTSQTPKIM
jgi:hypothetical protein